MNKECGIYEIRNLIDGKWYVGSSVMLHKRWWNHKYKLNKGTHTNTHLQSAWNKYGSKAFRFSVLLLCDQDSLVYYEQTVQDKLCPQYNFIGVVTNPMLGRKHDKKTKELIGKAAKGRKCISEVERLNRSKAHRGHTVSEETRKKIGDALRGYRHSEETRKKRSVASIGNKSRSKNYDGMFVAPDGTEYRDVFNLAKFSREHNLNQTGMSRLYLGKTKEYKGWKYITTNDLLLLAGKGTEMANAIREIL